MSEANDVVASPVMRLVMRLNKIERYDATVGGGCDCCGSWVEHDKDKDGDWVKWEDLESILKDLDA